MTKTGGRRRHSICRIALPLRVQAAPSLSARGAALRRCSQAMPAPLACRAQPYNTVCLPRATLQCRPLATLQRCPLAALQYPHHAHPASPAPYARPASPAPYVRGPRKQIVPGFHHGNRNSGMDDLGVSVSRLMSCLLYRTYLLQSCIVLSVFPSYVFVTDSHHVTGSGGDGGEATTRG